MPQTAEIRIKAWKLGGSGQVTWIFGVFAVAGTDRLDLYQGGKMFGKRPEEETRREAWKELTIMKNLRGQ